MKTNYRFLIFCINVVLLFIINKSAAQDEIIFENSYNSKSEENGSYTIYSHKGEDPSIIKEETIIPHSRIGFNNYDSIYLVREYSQLGDINETVNHVVIDDPEKYLSNNNVDYLKYIFDSLNIENLTIYIPYEEDFHPIENLNFGNFSSLKRLRIINLRVEIESEVWENINKLKNLETLLISGGQMARIPEEIKSLTNLQELSLTSLNLIDITNLDGSLKSLKYIDLSLNKIKKIPAVFSNLPYIQELNISENYITDLQKELFEGNLRVLLARFNKIKKIPDLKICSKLERLDLRGNHISEIYQSIEKFTQIKHLDLSYNKIRELPNSMSTLLGLEVFDISNTGLFARENYEASYNNEIKKLPRDFWKLKSLKYVNLNSLNDLDISLEKMIESKSEFIEVNLGGIKKRNYPKSGWENFNCQNLILSNLKYEKLPKNLIENFNGRLYYFQHLTEKNK